MSENILILYEEEIYANGLELLLKEINDELNVTKHIIYSDVEEILESEQFSMVIVSKEKTISVKHICEKIKDINKCCKIVFMGTSFTIDDIRRYVDYDVNGVFYKRYSATKLKNIFALIMDGETYYPTDIIPIKSKRILTRQEMKILKFLRQGYSNKQIAYDLNISESTVKAHMTSIMGKLNVVNRVQAIQKSLELGLIDY